jgi:hypothetical protein
MPRDLLDVIPCSNRGDSILLVLGKTKAFGIVIYIHKSIIIELLLKKNAMRFLISVLTDSSTQLPIRGIQLDEFAALTGYKTFLYFVLHATLNLLVAVICTLDS